MTIRNVLALSGIAAAVGLMAFAGIATADPAPGPTAQAEKLLDSYGQTNQKLASCMKEKGLPFNGGLAKSDIIDAFSVVDKGELTDKIRNDIAARTAATPDDPNAAVVAKMSVAEQGAWGDAVNDCSAKIDFEASGGAAGQAKIAELQRAAANSPEVKAAAKDYVTCMQRAGFAVDTNPFVVPQDIAEAEHGATATAIAAVARYDTAWRGCVQPWQEAFDQKLFG